MSRLPLISSSVVGGGVLVMLVGVARHNDPSFEWIDNAAINSLSFSNQWYHSRGTLYCMYAMLAGTYPFTAGMVYIYATWSRKKRNRHKYVALTTCVVVPSWALNPLGFGWGGGRESKGVPYR